MKRLTKISPVGGTNSWEELLIEFIAFKKVQGISEQTEKDYTRHVKLFFKRYPDSWGSPRQLKFGLHDYLRQEIKPATFNNRLVYLRTFFKWCVENEFLSENPLAGIKKRKDEGRVVNIDAEILRRLLEMPDQKTFTGLRDYALILLTLDTGIRPKEALSLVPIDFNPRANEVYITSEVAKTRVSRTLPISNHTVKAIRKLISVRPPEWGSEAPIFCTWEGKQLTRHTWGDRIEQYSNKLGVHIRPYDLRHAFALEYLRGGASAFVLQRTLGHSNMQMTKRYISLLNDDLKVEHAKASPLNNLLLKTKRVKSIK